MKGFVIPTKSFVKIGITKCLVLSTKRIVAAAKFLVAATKKLFVVPNFVAVIKPFFRCAWEETAYGLVTHKLPKSWYLVPRSTIAPLKSATRGKTR